jgi:type I restriction enzyme S subunit
MKGYKGYRDSGIEWIGKVPREWNVRKLKYLAKIKNGKDQKGVLIEEGGYPVLGTGGEFGRSSTFLYNKPSVLLGRKGTIDKPFYIEEPFWTVDTLFYTEIYENTLPKFLFYLTKTIRFEFYQESSAVPSMTQDNLNNIHLCHPSLEEQNQIIAFLDYKTNLIDATIDKKKRLIELLKEKRQSVINEAVTKGLNPNVRMKDSGLEWLGEIPEHWEVSRFNRGIELLTDYEANGSFESIKKNVEFTDNEGYAWYVRATDLEKNNFNDVDKVRWVDELTYKFLSKTKLIGSELLIAKRGEIGKVYLMPKTNFKATLAPNLYLVRLNKKLNPNFTWYYFESYLGKNQLILKNRSVTIGAIYKDDLKEIDTIFPPINEQIEIIDFLNKECNKIINLEKIIQLQIMKLQTYRQSLISEAVTGKIDVRDWKSTTKKT